MSGDQGLCGGGYTGICRAAQSQADRASYGLCMAASAPRVGNLKVIADGASPGRGIERKHSREQRNRDLTPLNAAASPFRDDLRTPQSGVAIDGP